MSDLSLKMIGIVAKGLDDLKDRAMFVGGADADTMGAITGGIAEAYYGGVPEHIRKEVLKRLPNEFIDVMQRFYQKFMVE